MLSPRTLPLSPPPQNLKLFCGFLEDQRALQPWPDPCQPHPHPSPAWACL